DPRRGPGVRARGRGVNRIFYAMVLIAFAVAGSRQLVFEGAERLPGWVVELAGVAKPADGAAVVEPLVAMSDALFDSVKTAVMGVVLPLIGSMAFFLGVMK